MGTMKTTTMNSLTSVSPTFDKSESSAAPASVDRLRLGAIALLFALVAGGALGSAEIDRANAVAHEISAAWSSLRNTMQDASSGYYRYGASSEYFQGQFSAEQWQQAFPTSPELALTGIRGG